MRVWGHLGDSEGMGTPWGHLRDSGEGVVLGVGTAGTPWGHQEPPLGHQTWLSLLCVLPSPPSNPLRLSPVPPPVPSPVLRRCHVPVLSPLSPVQAWVESLRHPEDTLRGLADLHPDVFAVTPR